MIYLPSINNIISLGAFFYSIILFLTMIILTSLNLSFILIFEFFDSPPSTFEFPIIIDTMSLIFFSLVLLISSAVIHYSSTYMSSDPFNKRFTILVLLFILSMMFLIFTPNLIAIMLGWDGLGLISFILVAYYQSKKSNSASMLTALSNRIGDSAILISIAIMVQTNFWNFTMTPSSIFDSSLVMFIILAAMTKSAQMPFSAWLPAAMAAPTPVSALVHSSTLVTAGIYLLIRFSPILMNFDLMCPLIFIGLLTSIMASLSGCFEMNMKKIVALSTLSQLGLMIATVSINMPILAFFHLLTHAMFKALLFISCGKIIHDSGAAQDIRLMGALMNKLPFTWITLNTANFALCGIPFLAGFYSKDMIFESTLMTYSKISLTILFSLTIALSTVYSIRMMYSSLVNFPLSSPLSNTSDLDSTSTLSMKILILPSWVGGASLSWLLFSEPQPIILPFTFKNLPLIFLFLAISLGLMSIILKLKPTLSFGFEPLTQMWFLPSISTFPSNFILTKSNQIKQIESGWLELLSAQGLYSTLSSYSFNISKTQIIRTSPILTLFAFTLIMNSILL
uniref:NADH dehydrogenase subunit 5 n=1 Tax=Elthusa poutassouiensis TaxID=3104314 RepID=UPI002E7785D8|nr:NADH dehydrogenase subunit 5 [Elthusa poutassouiensis]WPS93556.1 NADH dehydrogenase subunit 5 [Elthusa poutassouiensis]